MRYQNITNCSLLLPFPGQLNAKHTLGAIAVQQPIYDQLLGSRYFPVATVIASKKKNHTLKKLITLFKSLQNLLTKYTTWLMYEIWWQNNILLALQRDINFIKYYCPRSNCWFSKVHAPSCTRCIFSKCCKLGKPSYP